ncbi:MAG: hypothetical protein O9972_40305 [Burkholderiales bacterium]|nr:hypothetical protein [Burkholderiales bacterium]
MDGSRGPGTGPGCAPPEGTDERRSRLLGPGAMVDLAAGERHALRAEADSALRVTIVLVPPPVDASVLPPGGTASRPHGERTGPSADGRSVH